MRKILKTEAEKTLLEVGFSEKEIAIYIALLSLGKGIVTKISRTAGVSRTTTYDVLDNLSQKGLVKISGKEPKQEYIAESPDHLEKFIREEAEKKKNNLEKVEFIIPELFSFYNAKEVPKVRYYEGVEGLKEIFEDTLTAEKEIVGYAVGTDAFEAVGEKYLRDYFRRRVEKNIKVRVIAPDDPDTLKVTSNDKEELRESLTVPRDKFYFTTETNIYNNKILTVSWKEEFAVLIESKEIADAQKKIFELAWAGAKILGKEN